MNNIQDQTGGSSFVGATGLDPVAQKELEEATARFLMAACKAWPRAAPEFISGCVISITTRAGVSVRIAAGGAPVSKGGLILPGGRN